MKNQNIHIILGLMFCTMVAYGQVVQISIPRIAAMSEKPSPYNMRDWKDVALKYHSFVFDDKKVGTYLPLVKYGVGSNAYPTLPKFALHTYVGTKSPDGNEAINAMPAIIGSSLVGVDNRNYQGKDLVSMTQHFFNKGNGQNIYLNNIGGSSGNDGWYDHMPNVFFYQLYDLYPSYQAETKSQFIQIADQFYRASTGMGGSATPWKPAYMNYRAWDFSTHEPNKGGVPEPESAGAFAWIQYHAYKETRDIKYLRGAEWSMEFLDQWTQNPSYELQLPYGTYTAAKMNAEIGTQYNIEKLINWSFNKGQLRDWGTIVGQWGGLDVSGLVGEANDQGNDYAFLLNGLHQAAALVPMVRYDKRFADAIGNWVLHLANASRLFYSSYLPASLQDGKEWSDQYDLENVIAHESMKEKFQGKSPFATGDALKGQWAATNFSLYSSSSIGYLACLIEKTNVDQILKLNLNATDFFADASYPSFLIYNPYDAPKTIYLDLGSGITDVYDMLSESFPFRNVQGNIEMELPAKSSKILVQTPVGGIVTIDQNRMLVDSVVVDFMQTKVDFSKKPRIKALVPLRFALERGDTTKVFATISDSDSENLQIKWSSDNGEIIGDGNQVIFNANQNTGSSKVKLNVSDAEGNKDSLEIILDIVDRINKAPAILFVEKEFQYVGTDSPLSIICHASDPDGDTLHFSWSIDGGKITGQDSAVIWQAPSQEGIYKITVRAEDGKGLYAETTDQILVKNFLKSSGSEVANYPFSGNANDISGNNLNGVPKGVVLTVDRNGLSQSAYYFNGGSQYIQVANDQKLNFEEACTIHFWFKQTGATDRESFLISHGSWQNRWKVSITPTGHLRWTINTLNGIRDLDSKTVIDPDRYYQCAVSFDGNVMAIYMDGELDSYLLHTGLLRKTSLALLMGQMLPDDANYNFKGYLDDVRIFNNALIPSEVKSLFLGNVSATKSLFAHEKMHVVPNPATESIALSGLKNLSQYKEVKVEIFDAQGQLIRVLNSFKIGNEIDVSGLANGMYFLRLRGPEIQFNSIFFKS